MGTCLRGVFLEDFMTEPHDQHSDSDEFTGLSFLPTWRAVYAFVLAFFALAVLALAYFTRTFS
jgi:hypothetical protein